jgi:tRNA(fMet)-specific endonuclease VapC
MKFLLDTNAVIAVLKGYPPFIAQLKLHHPQDFTISVIVLHELFYGAYKSQRTDDNLAKIEALQFEVLAFDNEDAQCAGQIRALLASAGTPIGPYDALIAAQALARDLTLITHNKREFQRIQGLNIQDWQ